MREMENIGLNWKMILKPHMDEIKKQNENINVESLFAPLISMLNSNRIPSKVMISDSNVVGYSYILPAMGIRDRNIASMGFLRDEDSNKERGKIILEWLEGETKKEDKLLILDGLYNISSLEGSIIAMGYKKSDRIKLIGNIDEILERISNSEFKDVEMSTEVIHSSEVNPAAISEVQYQAYSSSPDKVLLILENGKNITFETLLSGYYGKILSSSSIVLVNSDGILGSITISDGSDEITQRGIPLIVDFFTCNNYRTMGYGLFILKKSLESLKLLGYKNVQLWVNRSSDAYNYYLKRGFKPTDEENTTYWKDFRLLNNGHNKST